MKNLYFAILPCILSIHLTEATTQTITKTKEILIEIQVYNENSLNQIYNKESYDRLYKNVSGLPANPLQYDENFFEELKKLYFTYYEFLIKLRNYKLRAFPGEEIYNDETYRKHRPKLSRKAPPDPFQFYSELSSSNWSKLLKECEIIFDK